MSDLTALPHGLDAKARTCRAVIESTLDFGFVPANKAENGDPLDIMVLHDEPLPMGVVIEVRLIGVI